MPRRTPPLTEEDRHLWKEVKKTVTPIHAEPEELDEFFAAAPVTLSRPVVTKKAIAPEGKKPSRGKASPPPVALDRRTVKRIRARRLAVEGRIDLHGMTLPVAQEALTRFILLAAEENRRTLLVITGKGRAEVGKIRREFPHWLESPPLSGHVIGFHVAHREDGGEGAFYVRIREQHRVRKR